MSEQILKNLAETEGMPTLKAIAMALGVPAPRVYAVAKQPQEGVIYDAKAFNWDAVERFVTKRLHPDTFETIEALIAKAVEIDAELKLTDKRRTSKHPPIEMITVDGKEIPKRRYPSYEMDSGMFVVLRRSPYVYKIVYQTLSHTVLVPVVNEDGVALNEKVLIRSNAMMNTNAFAPAQLDEEMAKRFADGFPVDES